MKNKILAGNLVVLSVYTALIIFLMVWGNKTSPTNGEGCMVLFFLAIAIHFAINVLLGIIMAICRKPIAGQYGLSAGLILLVGIFFNFVGFPILFNVIR